MLFRFFHFRTLLYIAISPFAIALMPASEQVLYSTPSISSDNAVVAPLTDLLQRKETLTTFELGKLQIASQNCKSATPLLLAIRNGYSEDISSVLIRYISYSKGEVLSVGVSQMHYFHPLNGASKFSPGSVMIQGPHPMITDSINGTASQINESDLSKVCQTYAAKLLPKSPDRQLLVEIDSITLASGLVLGKDDFGVVKRQEAKKSALTLVLSTILTFKGDREGLRLRLDELYRSSKEASAWNLKGSTNFVPIETANAAQYAIRGLDSELSVEQARLAIEGLIQNLNRNGLRR